MNGTRIAPLELLQRSELPSGNYLLLIEPQRVPPHLALISEGSYYSLSVKGVETKKEASSVLAALDRKGKELLLIGVGPMLDTAAPHDLFMAYEGKEPPKSSCLAPLLDLWGLDERGVETVHGLIAELRTQDRLRPPFLVRNSAPPIGEELWIPPYNGDEVRAHLKLYKEEGGAYEG